MSFLNVATLAKHFGARTVFRDLSFSLNQGECLLVKGANGSGKSTLISCLSGLLQPDEGCVEVEGEDIWSASGFSKVRQNTRIGILPQQNLLYSALTVEENLKLFSVLASVPESKIAETICQLGLEDYSEELVQNCSQGIARRVGFARTIITSQKFLLLDEPFANLDTEGIELCLNILKKLLALDACIVLSSHQSGVVDEIVSENLVLGGL